MKIIYTFEELGNIIGKLNSLTTGNYRFILSSNENGDFEFEFIPKDEKQEEKKHE